MAIDITPGIAIDENEIALSYIRASGPGGQNVNKVASAVQLRFDARRTLSLPNAVKARLQALAGSKTTRDGVIVITANRFRSQEQNREDAIGRLVALIKQALVRPVKRIPTRVSMGARKTRMEDKSKRGETKQARRRPGLDPALD